MSNVRPHTVLPNKACAVVLRSNAGGIEVLAFNHPQAGLQLVKGTIEPGETPELAAVRELHEEAGLVTITTGRHLGVWNSGFQDQVWSFIECHPTSPLPEAWVHHALDDGGKLFRFFWHPLWAPANPKEWHGVFQDALRFIQNAA